MLRLVFLFGFTFTYLLFASDQTKVKFNGTLVEVYFNDGDTFKILTGVLKNTRARLKGFNTLESYGPVHQWGTWKKSELYAMAQLATENARQGKWKCKAASGKDIYGRILVSCPDLARDQVQKGFAHVMSLDNDENRPELIALQQKAIASKVGIWQKGSVDYILTSTHSQSEKELTDEVYDRFVSVKDGSSLTRNHHTNYKPCETISYTPREGLTASAMVYVPFEQRYGPHKAACL